MTENKNITAGFILTFFLFATLASQFTQLAEANFIPMQTPQPAITIQKDGSISTASSPITRIGDTYALTGDINGYTLSVERDNTVIDGSNFSLHGEGNLAGVFIQAHNNVKIQNLNVSNFTYGIMFTWLYYGFDPNSAKANSVINNTLTNNTYGIYLADFSKGNSLTGNVLTNNTYGIYLASCTNNVLRNNRMDNNAFNFFVFGSLQNSINDIDISNTVDSKPIIYWINQQNKQIPQDAGYIALVNCTGITLQGFNLSHNGQALLLVNLTNSTITQNSLSDNDNAFWLVESKNNLITENVVMNSGHDAFYIISSNETNVSRNTFTRNGFKGVPAGQALANAGQATIWLSDCSNNSISNNTIANNGEGIDLQSSSGNLITANLFLGNNGTAIHLFGSTQNNIAANTITGNNGNGVKIWDSNNNTVQSNFIANNTLGILLDAAPQNSIFQNTVANNTDWEIQLKSASDTFMNSANNTIIHNNFINNQQREGIDVSIPGLWVYPGGNVPGVGNIWDDGHLGNYWSGYQDRYPNASQVPGAGVWNQSWVINENNVDNYPLLAPYPITSPQNTTTTPSLIASPSPNASQTILPTQLPATGSSSPSPTKEPTALPTSPGNKSNLNIDSYWIAAAAIAAVIGVVIFIFAFCNKKLGITNQPREMRKLLKQRKAPRNSFNKFLLKLRFS